MRRTPNSMAMVLAVLLGVTLQSISGAAAIGMTPVQLDLFGNPICAAGSVQNGEADGSHPGDLPDCCMLICQGGLFHADLPQAALTFLLAEAETAEATGWREWRFFDHSRKPANPRAPPIDL